jgi:hypothetical protein
VLQKNNRKATEARNMLHQTHNQNKQAAAGVE